jgi:hypothetical protein
MSHDVDPAFARSLEEMDAFEAPITRFLTNPLESIPADDFEGLALQDLKFIARGHGLTIPRNPNVAGMRELLLRFRTHRINLIADRDRTAAAAAAAIDDAAAAEAAAAAAAEVDANARDAIEAALVAAAVDEIAAAAVDEVAAITARASPLEPDGLRLSDGTNSAPPPSRSIGSSSSRAARGSPDPPVRSKTGDTSPGTPSAFDGFDVSAIVDEQVRQLNIPLTPARPPRAPTDVVTFADLSLALRSRDEDLKSLIKSNFDAIMAVLNSKQDSGPHTVRCNLSTAGAFDSPSAGVDTGTTRVASPSGGDGNRPGTYFRNHAVDVSSVVPPLQPHPERNRGGEGRSDALSAGGDRPSLNPERNGGGDDRSDALSASGDRPSLKKSSTAPNPYNRGFIKGHSPLADTKRGKANSVYLFGEPGIASVDELWYDDCLIRFGFPFEQHQAIVEHCREFLEDWCRPDINPKNVRASFRALETDVTPDVFVDWYTHLCYDLKRYDVCLMPFDNIVIRWEYVGLCYPGVGEVRYMAMGEALFSILDRLLPRDNGVIMDCTTSLLGFRHDGYRLLFMIMSRLLPVFCPSTPANPPRWDDVRNIALMAKYWNLYFRFVAKKGADFNPVERSLLFLDSLQEHSLLGVVASHKGSIQSFSAGIGKFDDIPPMPAHLTIDGLVQTLSTTGSPLTTSMTLAQSSRTVPLLITPASRVDIG